MKAHEWIGWGLLLLIHALGLLFSAIFILSPNSVLDNPEFRAGSVPDVILAWGLTWLALTAVGLAILLTAFRRGEQWAWYTLWVIPLLYLGLALLGSGAASRNLVTAAVAALGLLLTYRWFFARSTQRE